MNEQTSVSQGNAGQAVEPRLVRQFPWTREEDALVGKLTDREVAERLNRTPRAVADRRKFLGRPAVGRAPRPRRMEREPEDHYALLFGSKSNAELRAILGWSKKRVRTRRRQLASGEIRKLPPEWTAEEDRLLGTKPDRVLAREFGRSVAAVANRRNQKHIRILKPWRPEDEKMLGSRTDREIALLLGRNPTTVAFHRKSLGIPAKAKPRKWTAAEDAALGTKPDTELARVLRRTTAAVLARRTKLGIPRADGVFRVIKRARRKDADGKTPNAAEASPGTARGSWSTWSLEEEALLGKVTDAEVALKLGCTLARVRKRRLRLGVPCWNPNHRHWTPGEIALLGKRPDRELAKLIDRWACQVRAKRLELRIPFCGACHEVWKSEELALLGQLPDQEVATRTGHSVAAARTERESRGIPWVQPSANWRPEEDALLGTAPDQEIAARLNRTRKAVAFRRSEKGIPIWHDSPPV